MDKSLRREIEAECTALSHAFAYELDVKNYEALAALFAPNGVFIRTGVRLEGPAQILTAMSQRPAEQFTRHVTTNIHFTHIEQDLAKAVSYNVSYFAVSANRPPLDLGPQQVMVLDFIDTYTRTPQGWRFLERDARAVLIPAELRAKLAAATSGGSGH